MREIEEEEAGSVNKFYLLLPHRISSSSSPHLFLFLLLSSFSSSPLLPILRQLRGGRSGRGGGRPPQDPKGEAAGRRPRAEGRTWRRLARRPVRQQAVEAGASAWSFFFFFFFLICDSICVVVVNDLGMKYCVNDLGINYYVNDLG